jgi:hypothetical protein
MLVFANVLQPFAYTWYWLTGVFDGVMQPLTRQCFGCIDKGPDVTAQQRDLPKE